LSEGRKGGKEGGGEKRRMCVQRGGGRREGFEFALRGRRMGKMRGRNK
jgi:hypothetical protein